MDEVKKPIFIIGTGRSGTTIFFRLLAEHPQVAWLSILCDFFPKKINIGKVMMQLLDIPFIGTLVRNKFGPGECYRFWDRHYRGFSRPFRDLQAQDVTERARRAIKSALGGITTSKRKRVLIKITGWPRIGFLSEIFPGAKFIHVLRDGRAVANSLLNINFWLGWRGPQNWRWGDLPTQLNELWEKNGRSFVVLAGLQWIILTEAVERARQQINPNQFLQVKYEDFCNHTIDILKRVISFCELDWTPKFERAIQKYKLRSANFKWREDLTQDQQEQLNTLLKSHLHKYGYD